jgi:hypothetical protein
MTVRNFPLGAAFVLAVLLPAASGHAQQVLGVSPALPTSADEIRISVARPGDSCGFAMAQQGDMIILSLDTGPPGCKAPPPPDPFLVVEFFVPPLAPGSYTVVVMTDGHLTDSRPIFVEAPSTRLSLLQGRFTVSVNWSASLPGSKAASAVQLGDGSGYFWFFSAEDVDLTIKMISAVALDSHYWFFASSSTNLPFTITVTDTWLDQTHTYQSPAGVNRNILDFKSFSYLP